MFIELSILPVEIQQQIEKIEQGETMSFIKEGKVITTFIPKNNVSGTHQAEEISVYDLLMSQHYPDVSEVDLELPTRMLPPKHRLEVFD